MSILRPVSIFLRNFLVKRHPYFACCASCGEIKAPLGRYLCASLKPDFPVDAVVLPRAGDGGDTDALLQTAQRLQTQAPWLERIFVPARALPVGLAENSPLRPLLFSPDSPAGNGDLAEYARLHAICGLAENYIVALEGVAPVAALSKLDFFTPNGIPLVACAPGAAGEDTGGSIGADLLAQTRKNAAMYLESADHSGTSAAVFFAALNAWACAAGRAVLLPGN